MKTSLVSSVIFASFASLVTPQDAADVAKQAPCANVLAHEPLLLYEIVGSTLAAQIDRTLSVYADGSVRLASASDAGPGKCRIVHVDPSLVSELHQALVATGGWTLCDDTRIVTDVPLRTLTLLGKTPTTRAHTFSYWLGDEGYEAVDLVLEQFIADQFPDF
ncbi:MAG TPA: hypothetical protein VM509_04670 [Planctomycetota bacterium]|nr:hypothetical protein [Planctomycetota bacterium]